MAELFEYDVVVNKMRTTLRLTEKDAKRRGFTDQDKRRAAEPEAHDDPPIVPAVVVPAVVPADQPAEEPASEPVDEPVDEPISEPISEPVDAPADAPVTGPAAAKTSRRR